jgi:hypothetical protein
MLLASLIEIGNPSRLYGLVDGVNQDSADDAAQGPILLSTLGFLAEVDEKASQNQLVASQPGLTGLHWRFGERPGLQVHLCAGILVMRKKMNW